MSEPRYVFEVGAVQAGAASTVQLARTGSFYRVDQGKFRVTRGMLECMRDNAHERGVDLPLKLTHEGNTLAAGWVSPASLSVRPWRTGYGLFGTVTWAKDEALLGALRAGRSKYISPEIVWRDTRMADSPRGRAGEPIGPVLCGAALVLEPFFSMDAVQFSKFARALRRALPRHYEAQRYSMDQGMIDKVKEILKEKGLAEEALDGAVLALMMALSGSAAPEVEAPAEDPVEGAAAPEYAAQATLAASLRPLASKFGCAPTVDAILKATDATERAGTTFSARLAKLEGDVATEKKARLEAEKAARAVEFSANERLGIHAALGWDKDTAAEMHRDAPSVYARKVAGAGTGLVGATAPALSGALPTVAGLAPTGANTLTDEEVRSYAKAQGGSITDAASYKRFASALFKSKRQ